MYWGKVTEVRTVRDEGYIVVVRVRGTAVTPVCGDRMCLADDEDVVPGQFEEPNTSEPETTGAEHKKLTMRVRELELENARLNNALGALGYERCIACGGSGGTEMNPCLECGAIGWVPTLRKKLELKHELSDAFTTGWQAGQRGTIERILGKLEAIVGSSPQLMKRNLHRLVVQLRGIGYDGEDSSTGGNGALYNEEPQLEATGGYKESEQACTQAE